MKTTRLFDELAPKVLRVDGNKIFCDSDNRANRMVVNLSKNEKSKKLTYVPNIRAIGKLNFLTFDTKKAFNQLRLVFIKALIL